MSDRSIAVKWENDPEHPWFVYDDYAYSFSNSSDYTTSITGTFTCDRIAVFNVSRGTIGTNSDNKVKVYIDDELYSTYSNTSSSASNVMYVTTGIVKPGSHTIRIEHTSPSGYSAKVTKVDIHTDWVDINMEEPGSLGRLVLIDDHVQKLQDVELLKINGAINSEDWNTITQLSNLTVADLEGAIIASIPSTGLQNRSYLRRVILPEGLETISASAFNGTKLQYLNIPSTVKTIEGSIAYNTLLKELDFAPESQLETIGASAFYNTYLKEVTLPESVTTIGSNAFESCDLMTKISLGDQITTIPSGCFYNAKRLNDIRLPAKLNSIGERAFYQTDSLRNISLPESLRNIGDYAFAYSGLKSIVLPRKLSSLGYSPFYYCESLESATLHSQANNLYSTFYSCTGLKTLYCPVATPPKSYTSGSSTYPPLNGVSMSQVTLVVPDFAYEDYKLDSYWYKCGTIKATDEMSISDYWSLNGNLTLGADRRVRNTPDLTYLTGSSIYISGTAPQTFGDVHFNYNENATTRHLSDCDAITANSLRTSFYMEANKWYFFTPVTDVKVSDITHTTTESFVIRYYDGETRASENKTSGNWKNVSSEYLERGKGYIVQANKAGWLGLPTEKEKHQQFLGAGELSIPLTEAPCETAANANWNYVGNAYPTYFDIYYIDVDAPITVWTGSTYRALSLLDDNYALRPMQGFFVQKPVSNAAALMHKSGRQLTSSINHGSASVVARRAPEKGRLRFDIAISTANDTVEADVTRVVLNDRATCAYDMHRDATKFMSLDQTVPQIYTLDGEGTPLSINERPYADGNVLMAVSVPNTERQYVIHAMRAEGGVYLYDALTGLEHDLTDSDYWFTPRKNGVDGNRFTLRFLPGESGVEDVAVCETAIFGQHGSILVKANADSEVSIYSTDGRMITTFRGARTVTGLSAGVYVAKVNDETYKVLVK